MDAKSPNNNNNNKKQPRTWDVSLVSGVANISAFSRRQRSTTTRVVRPKTVNSENTRVPVYHSYGSSTPFVYRRSRICDGYAPPRLPIGWNIHYLNGARKKNGDLKRIVLYWPRRLCAYNIYWNARDVRKYTVRALLVVRICMYIVHKRVSRKWEKESIEKLFLFFLE